MRKRRSPLCCDVSRRNAACDILLIWICHRECHGGAIPICRVWDTGQWHDHEDAATLRVDQPPLIIDQAFLAADCCENRIIESFDRSISFDRTTVWPLIVSPWPQDADSARAAGCTAMICKGKPGQQGSAGRARTQERFWTGLVGIEE